MWPFMKWAALGLAQLWSCSLVRIFTWSQQNPTAPWGAEGFGSELHKTFSSMWYIKQHVERSRQNKAATEWTLPTESWHIPLMLTDRLSGRTSLFCCTLPQALDNAVAQLHEKVDLDLIQQRLVAALVQALTVEGMDRKYGAGPWGQLE